MKLHWTVEKLIAGERADFFSITRVRYGRTIEITSAGRRVILDVIFKGDTNGTRPPHHDPPRGHV